MSQSIDQTVDINLTAKSSWLQNRCREIVFSILNRMQQACLIIHESGNHFTLGNANADLVGELTVNDADIYITFVKGGSIGAAEAFLDQGWSSPDLTKVIQVFARSQHELDAIEKKTAWLSKIKNWLFHRNNANTQTGSKKNILAHYDLGNDLYERFLDQEMMYSAAVYKDNCNLEQAQLHKLDLICQRLELKPTDHLVEIGTGWGGMAIYAVQNYGCKVTTTTISDAQYEYATNRVKSLGLEDKITLLKKDYRLLEGKFDKLVSIEMIEAVGDKYLPTFFDKCSSLLKTDGKMLIQSITIADQRYHYYLNNVDFIQRYIFPGGCLPSVAIMSKHIANNTDMVIDNLHDIGLHYATTLKDWRIRFNDQWNELAIAGYEEEFKRLWNYYLCYCEGAFLERAISTVHLVARKPRCL